MSTRREFLATVGSTSPYVGLFGTVVGIIRAFQDMVEHGVGGFEVVGAGISEALVATAVGLFVAIVALLFFNYLQVRVGAISGTVLQGPDGEAIPAFDTTMSSPPYSQAVSAKARRTCSSLVTSTASSPTTVGRSAATSTTWWVRTARCSMTRSFTSSSPVWSASSTSCA